MEIIFPKPTHGIVENEIYSWDEMERCGWRYEGLKNQNVGRLELWRQADFYAVVNLDGKILSIKQQKM